MSLEFWEINNFNLKLLLDDYSTTNIMYIWEATIGSIASDPVWRIKKVDQTTWLTLMWAWWVDTFTNIWDNRLTLNYK